MNTNYSTNVAGALKLISVNGSIYQLGKDAGNTEGGIAKLFSGSGAFETYKLSTDGAYSAATVYDEINSIKTILGTAGESSITEQISDLQDGVAAAKTVVAKANGESYLNVTETTGADGHAIYTLSTTGIDSAISAAVAAVVNGAPSTFDTLKEIADWITADTTGAAAILADVANKADKVTTATADNFAAFDSNGNLKDSGKAASDFVAAESGKRLMTDAEGTKLSGIATGAEVNVIEGVKINGAAGTITNKIADLGSNFVQDASYVHTDNNYTTAEKNKLAAIEASIGGSNNDTLVIWTQTHA